MAQPRNNYDLQVDMARRIFMDYDQPLLIEKYALQADEAFLYLTYLNTPCRICRADGRIDQLISGSWEECRSFNTVMTIYDLL